MPKRIREARQRLSVIQEWLLVFWKNLSGVIS